MRFRDEFFKISRPKDGRPGMGIDVLHDAMTVTHPVFIIDFF